MKFPFKIVMLLGIFQLIMHTRYFGNIYAKLTSTVITNTLFVSILYIVFELVITWSISGWYISSSPTQYCQLNTDQLIVTTIPKDNSPPTKRRRRIHRFKRALAALVGTVLNRF